MKISSLRAILHALNHARIKYLIAGGVAVNIHGYQRMTRDLDLVIQLSQDNILNAAKALEQLGYRPNIPVTVEDFANTDKRKEWIETRHMQVLAMVSEQHPDTTLDIFITEPFDFDTEYQRATDVELDQDLTVKIVSIRTLIEMKKQAGRDRDKDDIQHLAWILEETRKDD
ncbi:MAG: nucleotidyl transferase AbiEii/AbiGii toxin family protein [Pseudomonadota bacterium]